MRKSIIAFAAVSCVLVSMPHQAKADGFLAGATVGLIGGAIIGAHASPYYYGPYGYAPAYYHAVPSHGYSYGYGVPTYGYSQPYYVTSPCWGRRLPVYDRFGGVVAVRYERACR
ncbi:MAG: hypothetical protein V4691_06100 [Pseudomonadota bacterium]